MLSILKFPSNVLTPPAGRAIVREPNARWARGRATNTGLRLTVADVVVETPSTRTFVLDAPDLTYAAGQHLTLMAKIDGKDMRRCYSFSTSPAAGGRPAVTVKRVEGGVFSNWLHDHLRVGDVVRATGVSGRFTVTPDVSASRHLVLVAGGVGITPLISMAETILGEETQSRVTLLYGSRSEAEMIFSVRLEEMSERYASRFRVETILEDGGDDRSARIGRLDGAKTVELLRGELPDGVYLCGPQPMMDSVVAALGQTGVESHRIHLERFQYAEAVATAKPTEPATLVFAASKTTARSRVGVTILDAAEEAGIALPSSCRMGGCGACKVKIDGRVVSAEPNCLTEQERLEGYALACCSWGDGRVVLRDY